ncbi:MAG TPA: hypothetical protein VGF90_01805, partial [Verrucomicrobiae bacterium]
ELATGGFTRIAIFVHELPDATARILKQPSGQLVLSDILRTVPSRPCRVPHFADYFLGEAVSLSRAFFCDGALKKMLNDNAETFENKR